MEKTMNKRKLLMLLSCLTLISIFISCTKNTTTESEELTQGQTGTNTGSSNSSSGSKKVAEVLAANIADHEVAGDYTWNISDVITIALNGNTITSNGSGVSVNGSSVTISNGGTYSFSGILTNGQIIVNSSDKNVVRLILNGVNITNATNAPVNIQSAEKTVIVLADNTQNYITDGTSYVFPNAADSEPNAAIFSKGDLSFYGNGSLTVKGNYNDAISSKDGLVIKSGTINVTSVDDGIRGKDYVVVRDGKITVNAKGDGLKSDNDEDTTRGYIYVAKGTLNITTGGDAITAETDVLISDGTFTITSGGGSNYTVSSTLSAKGIKGLTNAIIDGGIFTFSSADDAMHSNKNLVINGGTFNISSGDDGIHSDATLVINGGIINITKCYEGIESAVLTINDGTVHVTSSDDGINGAGGNDGSSMGNFVTTGNYYLYINGGYIYVNATGDGIDINGSIEMTNGTVIVNGPTSNNNGAIDYDKTFKLTGGFIVAAGSSGMAQAPGSTSSQYSVLLTLKSALAANTIIHIQSSDGTDILTFIPKKQYQSVALSSAKFVKGAAYDVYSGGSLTGTSTDGLYNGGNYSGGTKITSFTISSIVTRVSG
jgi:hypothetical protein